MCFFPYTYTVSFTMSMDPACRSPHSCINTLHDLYK
uniref:Uncharacterized protein n=1 Tax=Arundo donax TaxID=35708 RepID=A0A0A9PWI7_ARUDO